MERRGGQWRLATSGSDVEPLPARCVGFVRQTSFPTPQMTNANTMAEDQEAEREEQIGHEGEESDDSDELYRWSARLTPPGAGRTVER